MSSGANYTGADTISSGYMGIVHMVHQTSDNIVVGGEMDGRTLSTLLVEGKPAQGEIYVVSTSNSQETLISSTEASAQAQLLSSSAVDPGSVGGLTGSSAQTLQSQLGTFASLWSNSESVSMADSHGLVSQRCPSSASNAYVAIGCKAARAGGMSIPEIGTYDQAISLQRLSLASSDLQLMLVCTATSICANADSFSQVSALDKDAYATGVKRAVLTSIICGSIACALSILLALVIHVDFSAWILLTCAGNLLLQQW